MYLSLFYEYNSLIVGGRYCELVNLPLLWEKPKLELVPETHKDYSNIKEPSIVQMVQKSMKYGNLYFFASR